MEHQNLHTLSQQPIQGFDPKDAAFFDTTGSHLSQTIRDGGVAAIAGVTQSGRVTLLHSPVLITDDFNNEFAIQGNLSDNKAVRKFAQVDLSALGHIVSFTTKRPNHFSMGIEITGLEGTRHFGRRTYSRLTPNFFLITFNQPKFPSGQIDNEDNQSAVEEWSLPAAEIWDSILSVKDKYEPTIQLYNEISSNNREDELIHPLFTDRRIVPLHPFACVDMLDEEVDDVNPTLLQRFVPPSLQQPASQQAPVQGQPAPVAQPAQPVQPPANIQPPPQQGATAVPHSSTNASNQQIIVVNAANDGANQLPINIAKISLFFVCGNVNDVQPNTLTLPEQTSSFQLVLAQTTASSRFNYFDSLLETTSDEYMNDKNAMADMSERADPFIRALLGGCFAGNPHNPNSSSSLGSTELNLYSFGPQSNDPERVHQINEMKKRKKAEDRANVPVEQQSKTESLIPAFANILEINDVRKTMDNFKMTASAIVVLSGMKIPIIVQLYNEMEEFITSRDVRDWLKQYGSRMPWLHATLMVRLQAVYAAFAKFSRSFIPLSAINDNPTDATLQRAVEPKDTQFIKGAIASIRQIMNSVRTAMASHAPLSAETFCPLFERDHQQQQNEMSGNKRPVSGSAATGRDHALVNNQGRVDSSQQSSRGNAQRSNQNQRNQFRNNPRNQAPRTRPPTELGIFYIHNPNQPNEQIFPQDALVFVKGQRKKVCPDFTCFGKECTQGRDCQHGHPTNYARFDQSVFDSICEHFLSNNIGWLHAGMLDKQNKIVLAPRFECLRGDASGRFNNQG